MKRKKIGGGKEGSRGKKEESIANSGPFVW